MHTCRLCHASAWRPVIDLGRMPIAHRMLKSPGEREERFPFEVQACTSCGLPQIVDPIDPDILYRQFNFNFSSWKPEPHQAGELDTIFAHGNPKRVFEIGCNDGLFLEKLRERGSEVLVGVEPNPVSGEIARKRGIHVYGDMISPAICADATGKYGKFDLVVSRQVMEHIVDFENFFACVNSVLSDQGYMFIDVPDFKPGGSVGDVSILWEEHVSYFTEETIKSLMARHGFKTVSFNTFNFSGGGMAVCARRAKPRKDLLASSTLPQQFAKLCREYGTRLVPALKRLRDKGMDVVIYGAGCRACTWTNAHKVEGLVTMAVDDQKERQGLYMPGSRIPIHSPTDLECSGAPLVCLLAVNNENEEKVGSRLQRTLKRPLHLVPIFAPADIWGGLSRMEAL